MALDENLVILFFQEGHSGLIKLRSPMNSIRILIFEDQRSHFWCVRQKTENAHTVLGLYLARDVPIPATVNEGHM